MKRPWKRIIWRPGEKTRAALLYLAGLKSTRDLERLGFRGVPEMLRSIGVAFNKRRFISAKMAGKKTRLGAKHSPEARAKMSAARIGKRPTLGIKFSEAARASLRASWVKRRDQGTFLTPEEKATRECVRNRLKGLIRRVLRMTCERKNQRSEEILGYTKSQLRAHLEIQFAPGMSWERRGSFHVDHKVPVSWFLDRGITDPAIISSLDNLQVLTPSANRQKGARLLTPIPAGIIEDITAG